MHSLASKNPITIQDTAHAHSQQGPHTTGLRIFAHTASRSPYPKLPKNISQQFACNIYLVSSLPPRPNYLSIYIITTFSILWFANRGFRTLDLSFNPLQNIGSFTHVKTPMQDKLLPNYTKNTA